MTINDLRAYRTICAEIDRREEKLRRDRQHVVDTVQTAANFPYWKHVIPVEGDVYPYPVAPERAKIEALKERKVAIERFVAKIADYQTRLIFELYFLSPDGGEKITWERVADIINDGRSGDACRMAVMRYFDKFSK